MNYLLRLIMVGLLIVVCVWGIQPAALEDIEALSPSLLLTDQELDIQTEMLVEQPEMHVSKTARAILDQSPYLSASATEKVHKNAANLVTTTYQSNKSPPKPNTGSEGSHDSSTETHLSTKSEEGASYGIKSSGIACLVLMAFFIVLVIGYSCKNGQKDAQETAQKDGQKHGQEEDHYPCCDFSICDPFRKARSFKDDSYEEEINGGAPSLLRSSRYNV
jgi:hypothetical protein